MSEAIRRNSTTVRSRNLVRITRAALQTAYLVSDELGTNLAERLFTTPRRHPRPARELAVLASGRPFTVDVALRSPRWSGGHTKVAAWRWGFGPTVLLVHGWEGRGSQLGAFVGPLVEAGMSVVAFDAPGHGDSPGSQLYLTDHADVVADVAAHVGPLHAIVAHSFGAAAVLLAHGRHGLAAERNVMIAPNALIDDSVARFARTVALDDRDRATFEDHLASSSGLALDALGLEHLVGERSAALLVVHDRADREVPFEHGVRLADTWADATLVAVEDLGHRRILRDADVIGRTVEFAKVGIAPPNSDLVREVDRWLSTGR
jgi:pimeloyl-ACP methyl ester carboxylesterase